MFKPMPEKMEMMRDLYLQKVHPIHQVRFGDISRDVKNLTITDSASSRGHIELDPRRTKYRDLIDKKQDLRGKRTIQVPPDLIPTNYNQFLPPGESLVSIHHVRPTTSGVWRILIFVYFNTNYLQILLFKYTYKTDVA